jgi:transcriptional regulator with XRE-family HTH domain
MDLKSRIGHNIASLRRFQGHSAAELAKKTGMTGNRLEEIEAGKIDLDVDECEMIGDVLLVDVAFLFHPPFDIVPLEDTKPSTTQNPTTS